MRRPGYDFTVDIKVRTDHPDLMPLVERAEALESGTAAHLMALAQVLTLASALSAKDDGHAEGWVAGHDAGAAPFLEGPWWRRAWTAARS